MRIGGNRNGASVSFDLFSLALIRHPTSPSPPRVATLELPQERDTASCRIARAFVHRLGRRIWRPPQAPPSRGTGVFVDCLNTSSEKKKIALSSFSLSRALALTTRRRKEPRRKRGAPLFFSFFQLTRKPSLDPNNAPAHRIQGRHDVHHADATLPPRKDAEARGGPEEKGHTPLKRCRPRASSAPPPTAAAAARAAGRQRVMEEEEEEAAAVE